MYSAYNVVREKHYEKGTELADVDGVSKEQLAFQNIIKKVEIK